MEKVDIDKLFDKISEYRKNGQWQEIVELVDNNIENFRQDKKIEDKYCYQFPHLFDFIRFRYLFQDQILCQWVSGYEAKLLQRKLYALIELGSDESLKCADEILELIPFDVDTMFEKLEFYKKRGDIPACEKELNNIFLYIWKAKDFAKYLRANAWLSIEKEDAESAIHYCSWSVLFDHSQEAMDYVNNELNFIALKKNLKEIPRPSIADTYNHFSSKGFNFLPMEMAINLALSLYDLCLKEDSISDEYTKLARENLIGLCSAWGNGEIEAKRVEVNVKTENKLIVSYENGFEFQISKEYLEEEDSQKSLMEFCKEGDEKSKIWINILGTFKSDAQFESLANGRIDQFKISGLPVAEELVSLGDNIGVKKAIVSANDSENVLYFIKLNEELVGEIGAFNSSESNCEILKIIESWEIIK